MRKRIKILIVDDHAIVRTGLSALIEAEKSLTLVGEASNGVDAVEKARNTNPDVILMDLIMPRMNGIEAIQEIMKDDPDAGILVLTSFNEDNKVLSAIKAGALGYILKDSSPEELILAIHDVSEGRPSLHPSITRILMQDLNQEKNKSSLEEPLTEREKEVLMLIAQGLSNQKIAEELTISQTTVRFHVTNILTKLQLDNRTQAALYAIREGLIIL